MERDLHFSFGGPIANVTGGPLPSFLIQGTLENRTSTGLVLLNTIFDVGLGASSQIMLRGRRADVSATMPPSARKRLTVVIDFDRSLLRSIDDSRDVTGGLAIRLTGHFVACALVSLSDLGKKAVLGEPTDIPVGVSSSDGSDFLSIPRDQWATMLRAFGYSDLEIFEVPVVAYDGERFPAESVGRLREAEEAFRRGDWRGTLAASREAFESLAKIAGETDNTAQGAQALWERVSPDERKREPLNELVNGLKDFEHLGRHSKYPACPIDRDDALFALRASLSLFEYIGNRLRRGG